MDILILRPQITNDKYYKISVREICEYSVTSVIISKYECYTIERKTFYKFMDENRLYRRIDGNTMNLLITKKWLQDNCIKLL